MGKCAFYFGCRDANEPGHYLQLGHKTIWQTPPEIAFWDGVMDGGLLKNGQRSDVCDGKVYWTCGGRPDFWYAFYWWDRSGDRRPGSNSGFYVGGFGPENLTRETARENAKLAFEHARAAYPWVIERQRHPLVLQNHAPSEAG